MAPLYIALVHYPVLNKEGRVVTTSLTNFDIHDLARTSKTFGVKSCFMVTPIKVQQEMALYIKKYWQEGKGAKHNPDRNEAFSCIEVAQSIEETCLTIAKVHGKDPRLIATSARKSEKTISFNELQQDRATQEVPVLLLFGTGWGLAPEVMAGVDRVLEPIYGVDGYNHLPVRSAVAIILDRLVSR